MPGAERILIVDDSAGVRTVLSDALDKAGYAVASAVDGAQAEAAFAQQPFDLVVSDIAMPGIDGLELLRRVRRAVPDVPVILLSGVADAKLAIEAVNLAATAYLVKPIRAREVVEAVDRELRARRRSLRDVGARAQAVPSMRPETPGPKLDRALARLHVVYQPILSWSRREPFGFEATPRSVEPGLQRPEALVEAAIRAGRLRELGQVTRERCAETLTVHPTRRRMFVTIPAEDLLDETLYDRGTPFGRHALQIVLQIEERRTLGEVKDLGRRIEALRAVGYRVALGDVGTGYAGLNALAALTPDFVKIDASLVQGLDVDPMKHRVVRMLCDVCTDLGIGLVAQGVETDGERDALVRFGCDLMQGSLFADPGPPFPEVVLRGPGA